MHPPAQSSTLLGRRALPSPAQQSMLLSHFNLLSHARGTKYRVNTGKEAGGEKEQGREMGSASRAPWDPHACLFLRTPHTMILLWQES